MIDICPNLKREILCQSFQKRSPRNIATNRLECRNTGVLFFNEGRTKHVQSADVKIPTCDRAIELSNFAFIISPDMRVTGQ